MGTAIINLNVQFINITIQVWIVVNIEKNKHVKAPSAPFTTWTHTFQTHTFNSDILTHNYLNNPHIPQIPNSPQVTKNCPSKTLQIQPHQHTPEQLHQPNLAAKPTPTTSTPPTKLTNLNILSHWPRHLPTSATSLTTSPTQTTSTPLTTSSSPTTFTQWQT